MELIDPTQNGRMTTILVLYRCLADGCLLYFNRYSPGGSSVVGLDGVMRSTE